MERHTAVRKEISSITVVEPLPQLNISLSTKDADGPTVLVEGMTPPVAMGVNWVEVIKIVGGLIKDYLGDGGGGGGKGKCTKIAITNPDKSTTTIEQCSAP